MQQSGEGGTGKGEGGGSIAAIVGSRDREGGGAYCRGGSAPLPTLLSGGEMEGGGGMRLVSQAERLGVRLASSWNVSSPIRIAYI